MYMYNQTSTQYSIGIIRLTENVLCPLQTLSQRYLMLKLDNVEYPVEDVNIQVQSQLNIKVHSLKQAVH